MRGHEILQTSVHQQISRFSGIQWRPVLGVYVSRNRTARASIEMIEIRAWFRSRPLGQVQLPDSDWIRGVDDGETIRRRLRPADHVVPELRNLILVLGKEPLAARLGRFG